MKKTLHIHIGLNKTGTTTIQHFMNINRDALLKNDIFVPDSEHFRFHHFIGNYFCRIGKTKFNPRNLLSEKPTLNKTFFNGDQNKWLEHILEIKSCMLETKAKQVLISTESFICADPKEIKTFFEDFEVKIIVALRRQDVWLESIINQRLKLKVWKDFTFEEVLSEYELKLNYHLTLEPWANIFGVDSIKIIRFSKLSFKKRKLLNQFGDIFNLELNSDFIIPEKKNTGLNIDVLHYIKNKNIRLESHNLVYKRFLSLLSDFSRIQPSQPKYKYYLSPAERLQILQNAEASNIELKEKFLPTITGTLFQDPMPLVEEDWQKYPGLSNDKENEIETFLKERKFDSTLLKMTFQEIKSNKKLFQKFRTNMLS